MCYACEEGGTPPEARYVDFPLTWWVTVSRTPPGSRHVVIARDRRSAEEYLRDQGIPTHSAAVILPSDRYPLADLRGIVNVVVHRVEGARAAGEVEGYLWFLTDRFRAFSADTQQTDEGSLDAYRPHSPDIRTRPVDEERLISPHHWASTLERSPYWNREREELDVGIYDTPLVYRREELDEDVRYV